MRSSALIGSARAGLLALLVLAPAMAAAAGAPVALQVGGHVFWAEVAATPQQRERGLMGRTRLADDAGMLFVFEHKAPHCFWMKNTPLPLSIAFLADDGTIVNIESMQPHTLATHCARTGVRYALEVRQGRLHGVRPGMRVSGGPFGPQRTPR